MRREAFGEIGLLPREFYRMRYSDYVLLQQGFAEKRRYEQRLLRRAVVKLLEPYVQKGAILDEKRIWPIAGEEKGGVFISEKSRERLKQLRNGGNDSTDRGGRSTGDSGDNPGR